MARQESLKEDLVRDATAFSTRIEFVRAGEDGLIFFGRRPDGGVSIYFADESFYAFNPRGELRRAFVDATLWKAEGGRLVAMRRERNADASLLKSAELSPAETQSRLDVLEATLRELSDSLEDGTLSVARSASDSMADRETFREWLAVMTSRAIVVAQTPNAGG